jgi:hypothetical protein
MSIRHTTGLPRLIISLGILLTLTIGSVLAANIAIGNSNKPVEFGQGVYQLKACDSWIQLNLVTGPTGQFGAPSGYSALTGVSVQGLMPKQCPSTKFTIQALDSSTKVLPLYRTDQNLTLCSSRPFCVVGKNSESDLILTISASGIVNLINPDSYHSLTYDNSTGIYTFSFNQPGQLAQNVSTLTVQSTSNPTYG